MMLELSCLYTYIQLSAVITRPNITWYCTHHWRNWGRISIWGWTHKRHPYLALTGELWGVFCEYFGENWPWYNSTALYISSFNPYQCILHIHNIPVLLGPPSRNTIISVPALTTIQHTSSLWSSKINSDATRDWHIVACDCYHNVCIRSNRSRNSALNYKYLKFHC